MAPMDKAISTCPIQVGKAIDISAAQFIIEQLRANPGEITLAPVGPLTNIALALRLEPRINRMGR